MMPQTLSTEWESALGTDWADTHHTHLHKLGNLTLTGYNSELSNDAYSKKRVYLLNSHVELNKYSQMIDQWNAESIDQRGQMLAQQALKIWPYFGPQTTEVINSPNTYTGRKPNRVIILESSYPVATWKEVLRIFLVQLYELDPVKFSELADASTLFTRDSSRLFSPVQVDSYYIEGNRGAQQIMNLCRRFAQYLDIDDQDWRVVVAE